MIADHDFTASWVIVRHPPPRLLPETPGGSAVEPAPVGTFTQRAKERD